MRPVRGRNRRGLRIMQHKLRSLTRRKSRQNFGGVEGDSSGEERRERSVAEGNAPAGHRDIDTAGSVEAGALPHPVHKPVHDKHMNSDGGLLRVVFGAQNAPDADAFVQHGSSRGN
jgi:hypothetical protein